MIPTIAVPHHNEVEPREASAAMIQMMIQDAVAREDAEDPHQVQKTQDQEVAIVEEVVAVVPHVKIAPTKSSLVVCHGTPVRMSSVNSSSLQEKSSA